MKNAQADQEPRTAAGEGGDIDLISYGTLALMVICMGSTFLFNAMALDGFSVLGVAAFRIIIAAAVLVPLNLALGVGLPRGWRSWIWAAGLSAILMVAPFQFQIWGQSKLPSGETSVYFSAIPLLLLFFSRVILGVSITGRKAIGLVMGSVGLIVLASGRMAAGPVPVGLGAFDALAPIALVVCCILLALGAVLSRLMPVDGPVQGITAVVLVAAVLVTPLALTQIPTQMPSLYAWLGLLGVGVISTAGGQFLRFFLVRRRGTIFIAPNAYLASIFATILGVLLLGEEVELRTAIAFGIILSGLMVANDGSGKMAQT